MITYMDKHVGQILGLLDELAIADNTIVFFTSDNGAQMGGGPDLEFFRGNGILRSGKGRMYEGGLRVPMIVRWPGRIEPHSTSDFPWYFPDVFPTLSDMAGALPSVPSDVDGISVLPVLLGEDPPLRPPMYWELRRWQPGRDKYLTYAIRDGDWKVVRKDPELPVELYNLADDPGESHDLSASRPEVLRRLISLAEESHVPMRSQEEPEHPNGWQFN